MTAFITRGDKVTLCEPYVPHHTPTVNLSLMYIILSYSSMSENKDLR